MRSVILLAAALVLGSSAPMAQVLTLEDAVAKSAATVEAAVAHGRIPGAVLVIAVNGQVLVERAFGHAHLNDFAGKRIAAPRAMETSTVFDVASVTKVMATTMAAMLLVDQGKLEIDAPVYTYLPDFRGPDRDKITVRHLLTHTSGLVQWQPLYYQASNQAETYEAIRAVPQQWPVGEGYHYSDLGFMLLGFIVERASAARLDVFIERALYAPLGLKHTGFLPQDRGLTNFAVTEAGNGYERHMVYGPNFGYGYKGDPTSWNGWRSYVLDGEVNDGNAWYANGGVAGHAGLFSTGADLRILLELLLNRGTSGGRQLIRPETVDLFLKPGAHLGWRQPDNMPPGAFAHTGFTGTYVLGVPEAKLAFVLLTNRQNAAADEKGYFFDVGPLQEAAVRPLLDELLAPQVKP
ncbi:MAG: serine hydrolase domain-containing protein [Rhodospirillaceae bacterium]